MPVTVGNGIYVTRPDTLKFYYLTLRELRIILQIFQEKFVSLHTIPLIRGSTNTVTSWFLSWNIQHPDIFLVSCIVIVINVVLHCAKIKVYHSTGLFCFSLNENKFFFWFDLIVDGLKKKPSVVTNTPPLLDKVTAFDLMPLFLPLLSGTCWSFLPLP